MRGCDSAPDYRLAGDVALAATLVSAGVAAIFKAPLTGLVFALEVPYQEDFARRMLLPGLAQPLGGFPHLLELILRRRWGARSGRRLFAANEALAQLDGAIAEDRPDLRHSAPHGRSAARCRQYSRVAQFDERRIRVDHVYRR